MNQQNPLLTTGDHKPLRRDGREARRVFDGIVELIVSGALSPGTKLNEPELASNFGVSRGPLREAIRRLEERQLVRCTPNAGARVMTHSPEEILETFELREALEGMAAGLAAVRMTDEEITELRSVYEEEVENRRSVSWSRNFHLCIISGCRNTQISRILNEDFYRLLKLWRQTSNWLCYGTDLTWNDHRRILDAIENRDGESAEMLMRRHISRLRLTSLDNLNKLRASGGSSSRAEPIHAETDDILRKGVDTARHSGAGRRNGPTSDRPVVSA